MPIRTEIESDIGQIRILDFPAISEDKKHQEAVEKEIIKKLDEYNKNMEQIDVVLFFLSNGSQRELTDNGLGLIKLLHEKNIKIIFVMNGNAKPIIVNTKKEELKNTIRDDQILYRDFSNFIHTDFDQYYKDIKKNGISLIFLKI